MKLSSTGFSIGIGQFNCFLNLYHGIVIGPLTTSGKRKGKRKKKFKSLVVAFSQDKHRNSSRRASMSMF